MKEVFKNVINEDLTEYLPNIKASTLLIWGTLDTETPLSDAKIMESKIPDAGLVQITNGGHFSFLNNPVLFNAVVNKFLEGCD
jgi:pimeloyl-ACP methyl ester carboxylesterase